MGRAVICPDCGRPLATAPDGYGLVHADREPCAPAGWTWIDLPVVRH
ncbi:hypothetical protein ACFCZ3_20110 [Cellulosimicrobium cellulans]